MCFVTPQQTPAPAAPVRTEVVSKEDPSIAAAQKEKQRKGYTSTFATQGGGLMDTAAIKKVTTGS